MSPNSSSIDAYSERLVPPFSAKRRSRSPRDAVSLKKKRVRHRRSGYHKLSVSLQYDYAYLTL